MLIPLPLQTLSIHSTGYEYNNNVSRCAKRAFEKLFSAHKKLGHKPPRQLVNLFVSSLFCSVWSLGISIGDWQRIEEAFPFDFTF